MCPQAFGHAARILAAMTRYGRDIWNSRGQETGVFRSGHCADYAARSTAGNDPFITLQIGHLSKPTWRWPLPFDPQLDAGEDFDYYLRAVVAFDCVKLRNPFSTTAAIPTPGDRARRAIATGAWPSSASSAKNAPAAISARSSRIAERSSGFTSGNRSI